MFFYLASIESQNCLGWEGPDLKHCLVPTPFLCTGTPSTRSSCPKPHPTWPWRLPGIHLISWSNINRFILYQRNRTEQPKQSHLIHIFPSILNFFLIYPCSALGSTCSQGSETPHCIRHSISDTQTMHLKIYLEAKYSYSFQAITQHWTSPCYTKAKKSNTD